MSKLSDRFKKDIVEPKFVVEENPLLEALLEKVNSVPYWNEYTLEQQCYLVKCFVEHSDNQEADCEALISYVTAFGALQKFLDNENVKAVFVNDDMSVHIEIDGRVFNTEVVLSQNMLKYILNYIKYSDETAYTIDVKNDTDITIRKTL